jgi:prephenate dehydratase
VRFDAHEETMIATNTRLKVGTLGSAATFAGEATRRMRELYPEFGEPSYYPTMDACWDALRGGKVDIAILGTERTGQPHHGKPVITNGFYVVGQLAQPLNCNLYVKPGVRKEDIRKITGHGSIHQCTTYLEANYPGVRREMHELNSVAAAKDVMAGDGSMAVVGSQSLPTLVPGLELIASHIDDGAVSSWWAVSTTATFSEQPTMLVVTGRFGADGQLGDLIVEVGRAGYRLATAASFPVNEGVSVYDYLLSFIGRGTLSAVEKVVAGFGGVRLAGAFTPRQ